MRSIPTALAPRSKGGPSRVHLLAIALTTIGVGPFRPCECARVARATQLSPSCFAGRSTAIKM
jgi:hypothetical protein